MQRVEGKQLCLPGLEKGPDMAKLRQASEDLRHFTRATSTITAYRSDWKAFVAWCESTGRKSLPCDGDTLNLYITDRLEHGSKIASTEKYVAAILHYHQAEGLKAPDRTEVRETMAGAKRQRKEQPRRRSAFSVGELRKMCTKLDRVGSVTCIRDKSLILLACATGLRRSNVTALNYSDLRFVPRRGVAVSIASSKTDQEGKGAVIGVRLGKKELTCPVRALRVWLSYRGTDPGPLFNPVPNETPQVHRRMNPETVNGRIKAAAELIGLDPTTYGGHSPRATCVTGSHLAGTSVLGIMERTGHTTVEMVKEYLRNADPFAGPDPVAGMF